jgi:hypothetical protein
MDLLKTNSSSRIRSRDAFMLMSMWMESFPHAPPKTNDSRPTGCLLVSPQDRILVMEHSGESHAIVRAILKSTIDPLGCDIYVSRFFLSNSRYPCSLCNPISLTFYSLGTKLMVQAGIRKCYYFPSKDWELQSSTTESPQRKYGDRKLSNKDEEDVYEKNVKSVQRLILNNTTALTLYIPQWDDEEFLSDVNSSSTGARFPEYWQLDASLGSRIGIKDRWETIQQKFKNTQLAISMLDTIYSVPIRRQSIKKGGIRGEDCLEEGEAEDMPEIVKVIYAEILILARDHLGAYRSS